MFSTKAIISYLIILSVISSILFMFLNSRNKKKEIFRIFERISLGFCQIFISINLDNILIKYIILAMGIIIILNSIINLVRLKIAESKIDNN